MLKREALTRPEEPPTLSPVQLNAVNLLALGKSDTETAQALRVSRQTVNEWKNHNEDFQRALRTAQREIWEESRMRLRALSSKAIDTLSEALEHHNSQIAIAVLKTAIAMEKTPEPPPEKLTINVVYDRETRPEDMTDGELRAIDTGDCKTLSNEELRAIVRKREGDR